MTGLQGSGKSNRALATPKAPFSAGYAGRSAGEGCGAEDHQECVVTDKLDFENAAKWLATEWGAQLDKAFVQFGEFLRLNECESSQRPFTIAMMGMKTLGDRPLFKCKASNGLKIAK